MEVQPILSVLEEFQRTNPIEYYDALFEYPEQLQTYYKRAKKLGYNTEDPKVCYFLELNRPLLEGNSNNPRSQHISKVNSFKPKSLTTVTNARDKGGDNGVASCMIIHNFPRSKRKKNYDYYEHNWNMD